MDNDVILQARGLTKRYGLRAENRVTALKELSFTLKRGRIYGLVGNNGAGKTTLLRILSGLSTADEGSLSLFGSTNERELRLARRRLGVLVEAPNYYEDMTIMQNLRAQAMLLPRKAGGSPGSSAGFWASPRRWPGGGCASALWGSGSATAWPPPCWGSRSCFYWTSH